MKLKDLKFGRRAHVQRELKQMVVNKLPDGTVDSSRRILLVFPIFTHMLPTAFHAYSMSLLHAGRFCPTYKFDVVVYERNLIHNAMNMAADSCIQNPFYDAMIAFDDDCLVPMNTIARLIAHYEHGHRVVAAHGFMRNFPHTTTVGRLLKEGQTLFIKGDNVHNGEVRGFEWVDDLSTVTPDKHGLIDVDFCGMPAMLIAREVLMKIQQPAFGVQDAGGTSTHDIYFCNRAKDAGFPIKVDVTLECGHIGPAPVVTSITRNWARLAQKEYEERNKPATPLRVSQEEQVG